MKKVFLITSLLALATTQNLFLMEVAQQRMIFTKQQLVSYSTYIDSLMDESNKQEESFLLSSHEIDKSTKQFSKQLNMLYSELKQLSSEQLPIHLSTTQDLKEKAFTLRESLQQVLETKQGIQQNFSIIKKAVTSSIILISDEKERDKAMQDLTGELIIFNKNRCDEVIQDLNEDIKINHEITIDYDDILKAIEESIDCLELLESSIKIDLKEEAKIIASIKAFIINSIALSLILSICRYIYKTYQNNSNLLFKSA